MYSGFILIAISFFLYNQDKIENTSKNIIYQLCLCKQQHQQQEIMINGNSNVRINDND